MEGGWYDYQGGDDEDRKLVIDSMETDNRECEVISRGDVPKILSPEVKRILIQYAQTKKYGLPYVGGWAEQPCIAMDIIWCLDNEDALIMSRRAESGNR